MKILTELPPEVKKGQMVSFDFETFGQEKHQLHRPTGIFACISVAIEGHKEVYQLYDQHDLRKLVPVIKNGLWVAHNALYDLQQFRRFATIKPRFMWDTMLVDQSMQGGLYTTFGLGDLSRRWLGVGMDKETREEFYEAREMTRQMKQYAARDALRTLEIALLQRDKYSNDPAFRAYTVADEPMIFPLLDMPGIRIDVEGWEKMVAGFQAKATALEEELELNVFAWAKVKERLHKRGLHVRDTKNDTLVEYIDDEFVAKIIEARLYRTATSRYGQTWLEKFVEGDGKVYASYHITGSPEKGVATGRMSCSNPNMQNIPARKLPVYREQFLASEDYVMEVWDIHQQEPCILAWHTQDSRLLEAIRKGEDLHLAVARVIFGDPDMEKSDKRRDIGKTINLGTSYGLTKYGLARKLHIEEEEADTFLNGYFRKFAGVFSWIGTQQQQAFEKGYVTTALGRRSYVNPYDHSWQNNAINAPIQGGAADFTKVWARKFWEHCNSSLPYTTVGLVHDEFVKDTPHSVLKKSQPATQAAFEETAELLYKNIPFTVDMKTGRTWACKSIKEELALLDEEGDED